MEAPLHFEHKLSVFGNSTNIIRNDSKKNVKAEIETELEETQSEFKMQKIASLQLNR